MFNNFFFSFENHAFCEITRKYILKPGRPQMGVWRMRIGCWITKVKHTLTACNNYCFPTTTMVARTRLNITLYVHCMSCVYVALLTSLYSINSLVFVTETECIECAGGPECSIIIQVIIFPLKVT